MVPSLNLEYIILHIYYLATGVNINIGVLPAQISVFIQDMAIIGFFLSVVFVIMTLYANLRMHEVEHEAWHKRDHLAHSMHEHAAHKGQNPQWQQVMALATSSHPGDWRRAIIEADIMLGIVLSEQGYRGSSIGEQLKTANPLQFTSLDAAWRAHKVRNEIAHLGESYELTQRDFQATLDGYRRVFEEFGYI